MSDALERLMEKDPARAKRFIASMKKRKGGKGDEEAGVTKTKKQRIEDDVFSVVKEREKRKKERRRQIKELKINRDLKFFLINLVKNLEEEIGIALTDKTDKALEILRDTGKFYKCDYISLKRSDVSLSKLKALGEDGWKFCFDIEDKFYFQRERKYKGK
jgi:hypothetical protein